MQSKPDKGIALLLLALAAVLGAGVGFGTSINQALPLAILFGIVAVILRLIRPLRLPHQSNALFCLSLQSRLVTHVVALDLHK